MNGLKRYFSQVNRRNKSLPNKARDDKPVSLVECMLELHKRSPRLPQEKESLQREIESTDGMIDRLVYELYGLSEEEIAIVEQR